MALGVAAAGHEARPPQDAQVLRDRRLRDTEVAGELADGVGTTAESVDEPAPRRVGQCLDRLYISHNLYKYMLMY